MAGAVMGPLLGTLQELVTKEARAMVEVNNEVWSLRDKLMWLQAFLRDAEPRRRARNDELMRVCLHQIRDAVFDAEDAVDSYFFRIDLSKYPSWSQAILKFFTEFTTQVRVRSDLSRRITSINTRLESIISNRDRYRIDSEGSSSLTTWTPSTDKITAAIENLDRFSLPLVGRDVKRDEITKALSGETKSPMVITVSGESGVGKTKLVKAIYEEWSTKERFKTRVWVSFASDLSTSQVLKLILLHLALKDKKNSKDNDDLSVRLKAALKAKSYLLVLDGEVGSTEWNEILAVLPTSSAKSRVVRITQTGPEKAAPSAGFGHYSFILGNLEKYASTELFLKTLYKDKDNEKHNKRDDNEDDRERKKYVDSIHRVTGGLPLSVVLLAGLLRTKEFPGEWRRVFGHLMDKSTESKRDDIILSMCFDDLPHDLKSCFLYFACFPVNMLIKARTMVCWWMAEGFLRPREGMTMEKVGSHYLNELAHRCLINVLPVEYADPGFERVNVQTRVHDFLLREAQEACFVEVHSGDDVPTLSTTRRLSLQNHSDKYTALATRLPQLRSIFSCFEKGGTAAAAGSSSRGNKEGIKTSARVFSRLPSPDANPYPDPKKIIQRLLQNSKFLRVISLDGLDTGIALPHEIGNVVHLQYLRITSCSLQVIPPSIGKLTRLQTLDVRDTYVTTLPLEFWKIRTLRHVFGSIVLPKRVGCLEQLRNLTAIKPGGDCYWDRKTFAKMIRLDTLDIDEISANNVQAIYKLKYLVILNLSGEVIPSDLFTRSNLPRLQVMRLDGKIESPLSGGSFTLPTLTKLVLKNTMVSQSFIDQLGNDLPLLSILVLLEGSCDTEQLVFKSGFHSITYVTLDLELHRVEIQEPTFDHLVQLEIIVYSLDLCVYISDKPDIKNKITLDHKYLRGMTTTPPEVPQVLQAMWKLMDIARGTRMARIYTKP